MSEAAATGIRRILVALDASSESLAALEEAASLAARLEAELDALFVEDIDLLNLAALPFAREFNVLTRGVRSLDRETIERDLRLQASRARRALAEAAERRRLHWSFQVARGRVDTEILAASCQCDVIAVPKATRSRSGLGYMARALVESMSCSVLLASAQAVPRDGVVAVVLGGAPSDDAALDMAGRLAFDDRSRLVVLLTDEAITRPAAEARLKGFAGRTTWRRIASIGASDLSRAVEEVDARLLVVATDRRAAEALAPAIEQAGCTVLLVRAEG